MNNVSGQNLTCIRGYTPIFTDLSFSATAGELLLLTGANGCGKTTLLRIMAGLLTASGGRINAPPTQDIFWLAQDLPLKDSLTVRENLRFLCALLNINTTNDHLNETGLLPFAEYPARYLSSGQKRRIMLCLLMASPRKIILMDEPTTNLDTDGIELLLRHIANLRAQGRTLIIATHQPEIFENATTLDVSAFSKNRRGAA